MDCTKEVLDMLRELYDERASLRRRVAAMETVVVAAKELMEYAMPKNCGCAACKNMRAALSEEGK